MLKEFKVEGEKMTDFVFGLVKDQPTKVWKPYKVNFGRRTTNNSGLADLF
jgi:hypothetical protein